MHFSKYIFFFFQSIIYPYIRPIPCSILQSENSVTLKNDHSKVTTFNKWKLNFFGGLFFYAV